MLVLAGKTFASRLWCVWEMYTFLAICPNQNNRIVVASLDSNHQTHMMLKNFTLSQAHCSTVTDEQKLHTVIEAGGPTCFENTIRGIGEQVANFLAREGDRVGPDGRPLSACPIVEFEFHDIEAAGVFRATAINCSLELERGEDGGEGVETRRDSGVNADVGGPAGQGACMEMRVTGRNSVEGQVRRQGSDHCPSRLAQQPAGRDETTRTVPEPPQELAGEDKPVQT